MRSSRHEKRSQNLILAGMLFLAVVSAVQARPFRRYDPGSDQMRPLTFANLREGYRLFQGFCRECHSNDAQGVPILFSESFTMAAWSGIFHERHVACAEKGSWHPLTAEQLARINDYLYHEAFDARNSSAFWDWDGLGFYR